MHAPLNWFRVSAVCVGIVGCSAGALDDEHSRVRGRPVPGTQTDEPQGSGQVPAESAELCNGSDSVRLAYSVGGGIAGFSRSPYSRFDATFLAIDGHCNYWFGGNGSIKGIRGGTFEAAFGSELSTELYFGRYGSAPSYQSGIVCFDGSPETLWDGTGVVSSSGCGPDPEAPEFWSSTFERVYELFRQVEQLGEPRWRPSRVLVIREQQQQPGRAASRWSASMDLAAYAIDMPDDDGFRDADTLSILVEDLEALSHLDDLRRAALEFDPFAADLYVEDSHGQHYRLLVRDTVPDKVASAIRRLGPSYDPP